MRITGLAAGLVVIGSATVPSPASAATVSLTGTTISYQAVAGETNNAAITEPSPSAYRIQEFGATTLTAVAPCTQFSATIVECIQASPQLAIDLLNGSDSFNASGLASLTAPTTFNGGGDSDTLTAPNSGSPILNGGDGNDTLTGGTTADTLNGDGSNDRLKGEPTFVASATDSDTFNGGAGNADQVVYTNRSTAVNVTLDNVANDGQSGENDNVGPTGDVEDVEGGTAGDTLTGNGEDNLLQGMGGSDTFDGGLGEDVFDGGTGAADTVTYASRLATVNVSLDNVANDGETGENDSVGIALDVENVTGGSGNDTITGSFQPNLLQGGPGTGYDRLTGNLGSDVIDGGAGIDRAIYGSTSTASVIVDLDNSADDTDGTGSTTENVMDTIESITGGDALAGDTLTGSCFNNVLAGQDGNDTLNGDPAVCPGGLFGNDFMGGGDGNDTMRGSVTPSASDGIDRVTYTANTIAQPTNITLDGTGNDTDGVGGVDNVGRDIEYLYGGPAADTFSACGQDETPPAPLPCLPTGPQAMQGVSFWGGLGNDVFFGSDMNDYMDGMGGADAINCEGGSGDMNKTDDADTPAPVSCETAVP